MSSVRARGAFSCPVRVPSPCCSRPCRNSKCSYLRVAPARVQKEDGWDLGTGGLAACGQEVRRARSASLLGLPAASQENLGLVEDDLDASRLTV